jgi:hypothetical protein
VKILSLSLVGILLVVTITATGSADSNNINNNITHRLLQIAKVQLTDNNNSNNYADISIVSRRILRDVNLFHIVGEVQNTGRESAEFVQIVASFYNSSGTFFGTRYAFTTPITMSPGMKAPFDIDLLIDDKIAKESKSYQLTVSWIDQNGKEIVKPYKGGVLT